MKPVVPTTAWTPCSAHQRRFSRAASTWVKSTATSAPASLERRGVGRDLEVGLSTPGDLPQVEAGVVRVDGGDQLEVGVGRDGPAHRGAHPAAGPEDPDAQHGDTLRPALRAG